MAPTPTPTTAGTPTTSLTRRQSRKRKNKYSTHSLEPGCQALPQGGMGYSNLSAYEIQPPVETDDDEDVTAIAKTSSVTSTSTPKPETHSRGSQRPDAEKEEQVEEPRENPGHLSRDYGRLSQDLNQLKIAHDEFQVACRQQFDTFGSLFGFVNRTCTSSIEVLRSDYEALGKKNAEMVEKIEGLRSATARDYDALAQEDTAMAKQIEDLRLGSIEDYNALTQKDADIFEKTQGLQLAIQWGYAVLAQGDAAIVREIEGLRSATTRDYRALEESNVERDKKISELISVTEKLNGDFEIRHSYPLIRDVIVLWVCILAVYGFLTMFKLDKLITSFFKTRL